MSSQERYLEGDEDIGLSEETIHNLILETWSGVISTLSEEDISLGLEQTTTELFDGAFQPLDQLSSAPSDQGDDRDIRLFARAPQASSNDLALRYVASGNDLDLLDVSSSELQFLRSPSEIYEQFPALETVRHTPGPLSDHRQTFTEVRHPRDLAEHLDVTAFLELWGRGHIRRSNSFTAINFEAVQALKRAIRPLRITARDVAANSYDHQGIDWHALGVMQAQAQDTRKWWYKRTFHRSPQGSTARPLPLENSIPSFHFHAYTSEPNPYIQHYQLRNLVTAPTRNIVFLAANTDPTGCLGPVASYSEIECYSPTFCITTKALSFPPSPSHSAPSAISCLTSSHDVLAAGGAEGEYAYKYLQSANDGSFVSGVLSPYRSFITSRSANHIHITLARYSGIPQLVCASNDKTMPIIDTSTNTMTAKHTLPWPVNCSVTSPDRRLRLVTGDHNASCILNAETGRILVELHGAGHTADGFACDWDEAFYVATGHADGMVSIWDARRWDKPVKVFGTEVESARSLKFSEPGIEGGKRLLVAEAADVVSVVDASNGMFEERDVVGVFGEIAGVDWVGDGEEGFVVGIADKRFGGILEFKLDSVGGAWENEQALW